MKDKANGVAGLDSSGNMTAPVAATVNAGATAVNGTFQSRLSAGNTGADQFTGLDSVLVGGSPLADVTGQLVSSGGLGSPSKISVFGSPDGTFNEGCSVCIFMGRTQWNRQRAAVSGIDYRAGAAAVTVYNDAVDLYLWSGNIPPYLGLAVNHYDATHVYLKTPLTKAQMALLHTNQYLVTNSLYQPTSSSYSAVTEKPATGTTWQEGYYKRVISGWDTVGGTYITVSAWAAPASGDVTSGQIPTPTTSGGSFALDTTYMSDASPTVYVGAVTGITSRNDFITLDQRNLSFVRSAQVNEQDLHYYANSKNSIAHDNILISDAGIAGSPYSGLNAFTTDSRVFRINTQKPVIFDIGMEGAATLFKTSSFWVNGQNGVNYPNSVDIATMAEWGAYADGTNKMNIVSYLKKESSTLGAAGTSAHLALELDGTFGTPETGTQWGQIAWNAGATNAGGVALCGNQGTNNCGVSVGYDNSVTTNSITVRSGKGINFTPTDASSGSPGIYGSSGNTVSFTTSTGSQANISAGHATFSGAITSPGHTVTAGGSVAFTPHSGSDSGVPYITASDASTLSVKTSAGGVGNLSANTYAETLSTPASSSATCTAGQFTDDANYHYVCIAANTWKRAALSSF